MLKKNDMQIIAWLRQNARISLTDMSKKTHIPISTIFDKLKTFSGTFIEKHTSLINYPAIGYNTRAHILLKVRKNHKEELRDFLLRHQNVNSVYKINNGYDFIIEVIFKQMNEIEEFKESIEEKFDVKQEIHYIISDVKREAFMTDSVLANPL